VAPYDIRIIGDPVLRQRAGEVTDIDARMARLVEDMFVTMYDAPGLGLAAPQIGVQKRLFVYDHEGHKGVLINPVIKEHSGEWDYSEGCLSVPGLYFEIVRPKQILIAGLDLDGNDVEVEADEIEGRLFQHELDHLDGTLLVEHLNDDQRKAAKKELRGLMLGESRPKVSKVINADGSVDEA